MVIKQRQKKIKEELLGAIYELGPASESEIKNI